MSSNAKAEAPIPVWIDVDTGHDDAFALLLAAHSPQTKLLGVSTVHGNASLKHTTYNTRSVLEAIGCGDVKVYPGSTKPMERAAVHAQAIHGDTGLDGVTLLPEPTQPAEEDTDYIEAAYRALKSTPPGTAWLVTTGTLTNAAKLILKHPGLAYHLAGLSIMGGAIGGGFTDAPMGKVAGEGERFGNWTSYAEFNIYCDPEAANILFNNPTLAPKTTLIPLDLSHQCLGIEQVRKLLLFGYDTDKSQSVAESAKDLASETSGGANRAQPKTPTTVRALFHEIMTFFAQTYADVFALTEGPPLHDPLALAAILNVDLFDDNGGERFSVSAITEGYHTEDLSEAGQMGRTSAGKLPSGQPGIRIPRKLNVDVFWSLIESALQKADQLSPLPPLNETEAVKYQALYSSLKG